MSTKRSPLHEQLLMVRLIAAVPTSTFDLTNALEVSERTVKRYVSELRHLGAELESVRRGGVYYWRCTNWPAIERIVTRWLELEEARDLREARHYTAEDAYLWD